MKIAQINFTRVNNALGGTEKVFFTMANALTERGHSVGCFYYDTDKGCPAFPIDSNVYIKNCFNVFVFIKSVLLRMLTIFAIKKDVRRVIRNFARTKSIINNILKFNPDVILIYWPDIMIYDLNKLGIPVVQMIHMAPSYFETENNFRAAKKGLEDCDCIQVLMPEHKEELYSFVKNNNIVHIPNIVPQYDTQSDVRSHTIIFLGRITTQKRPWLIVEAFALLKDKYPDWRVELWGEESVSPKVTENVRSLIRQYGLEERILFCGTTLDVKSKLEKASIMLMPSAHEGFCLALTEGMSMGLPAVACKDCSALNTLVCDEKNGFLCEPSPESIALSLSKLMESYELRKKLGKQAKEDMKQYSPESVYDKWEQLLQELIAKKKAM